RRRVAASRPRAVYRGRALQTPPLENCPRVTLLAEDLLDDVFVVEDLHDIAGVVEELHHVILVEVRPRAEATVAAVVRDVSVGHRIDESVERFAAAVAGRVCND